MDIKSFELLLSDLYDVYNPSKKSDIPNLLTKYNGKEYDAIYQLLFKYNYPKSVHYNEVIGTDKNIQLLINSYSAGERIVHKLLNQPVPSHKEKIEEQIKATTEQSTDQLKTVVSDNLNKFDKLLQDKIAELNRMIETVKQPDEQIEIRLNILWTEKELKLPSAVNSMAIGTRFMVFDVEDKFHGMEIKDIFEDFVSIPGKRIKEITIDKI